MKEHKKQLQFIQLRAEGKSYQAIGKELHISKDTCSKWEYELKEEVMELKQAKLNELIQMYFMTKEARITALGETLKRINNAIANANLLEVPADKLLDMQLKYITALKGEYLDLQSKGDIRTSKDSSDVVLNALKALQAREEFNKMMEEIKEEEKQEAPKLIIIDETKGTK